MSDDLDNIVTSHLQNVKRELPSGKKQYSGHVDGEEKYMAFLDDLRAAGYSYSTRSSTENRKFRGGRILFKGSYKENDMPIPYCGSPFIILKTVHHQCSQGASYYAKPPTREQPNVETQIMEALLEHPYSKQQVSDDLQLSEAPPRKRSRNKPSKKIGCPAYMSVKCIRLYHEHVLTSTTYSRWSTEKILLMKRLKADMMKFPPPNFIVRYQVVLSPAEDHNHTIESANLRQILHPKLREEITRLVTVGICSISDIKTHLEQFVLDMFEESKLPRPDVTNRGYYPNRQVLYYHRFKALERLKLTRGDENTLGECIEAWKSDTPLDSFYFRPCNVDTEAGASDEADVLFESVLFCHQTQWQRDAMRIYGNNVCLLDPAFKTTKCNFPVYFVVVKCERFYLIVGTFIVQSESSPFVTEALTILRAWNPEWQPKFFLSDLSEASVNGVEAAFPGLTVNVCAFHREQAWHQWFKKSGNVSLGVDATLKDMWRVVASSKTEDQYEHNINNLYSADVFQDNVAAQTYFTDEWLSHVCRWVTAYLPADLREVIHTYADISLQYKLLKHSVILHLSDKTLTGIVRCLVEQYIPDVYCSWLDASSDKPSASGSIVAVQQQFYSPSLVSEQCFTVAGDSLEAPHRAMAFDSGNNAGLIVESVDMSECEEGMIDGVVLAAGSMEPMVVVDEGDVFLNEANEGEALSYQCVELVDPDLHCTALNPNSVRLSDMKSKVLDKLKRLSHIVCASVNVDKLTECLSTLGEMERTFATEEQKACEGLIVIKKKRNLKCEGSLVVTEHVENDTYKVIKIL